MASPTPPESVNMSYRFWLIMAIGASVTCMIWLGVIEVANARVGGVLENLPRTSTEPWAHQYFSEQDVRKANPQMSDEEVGALWNHEAGLNHLYRICIGFGTTLILLGVFAVIAGFLTERSTQAPRASRLLGATACAIGVLVLMRAFHLGVLTHGFLTALSR